MKTRLQFERPMSSALNTAAGEERGGGGREREGRRRERGRGGGRGRMEERQGELEFTTITHQVGIHACMY